MLSRIFIRRIGGRIKIKDRLQRIKITVAGAAATFGAVMLGQPFDTVKVRMQRENKAMVPVAKSFFNKGFVAGVNGLYRGMLPTASKRALLSSVRTQFMFGVPPAVAAAIDDIDEKGKPGFGANVVSAFAISGPDTLMCNLFEFMKVYKQTGGTYKSMFSREEGLSGKDFAVKISDNVLRGYWLTYFKTSFGWTSFLVVYKAANDLNKTVTSEDKMSGGVLLAAAGIESGVKVAVTNPVDVVKTYVQSAQNVKGEGAVKIAAELWNKHGGRVFARGAMPRLVHSGASSFIGFAAMEADKRWRGEKELIFHKK